jgi:hypothetical protein
MSTYFNIYEKILSALLTLQGGQRLMVGMRKACLINAVQIFSSRVTMTEKKLQRQ